VLGSRIAAQLGKSSRQRIPAAHPGAKLLQDLARLRDKLSCDSCVEALAKSEFSTCDSERAVDEAACAPKAKATMKDKAKATEDIAHDGLEKVNDEFNDEMKKSCMRVKQQRT